MTEPAPLLIYDGDCGFCRGWALRWQRWTLRRAPMLIEPSQTAALRFPEVPPARWREAVALLQPDGRLRWGADAVFQCLAAAPGLGWLARAYARVPGFARLSEAAYAWVSAHRAWFSRKGCKSCDL